MSRYALVCAGALTACASTQDLQVSRSFTERPRHDCFRRHLEDAIALNRERRPRYAALSDGASNGISDRLIASEVLTLPIASYFDWRASEYQRVGIPLMCDEFVSMDTVGATPDSPHVPAQAAVRLDPHALRTEVERHLAEREPRLAADRLRASLEALSDPGRACMQRHLLESALRAVLLAVRHSEQAAILGLPDPRDVSVDFVRVHLLVLEQAEALDRDAESLNARGVAIVCADLPRIPAP
jgi:hypothetical protein